MSQGDYLGVSVCDSYGETVKLSSGPEDRGVIRLNCVERMLDEE